jgi:hypothetical protein
MVEAQPSQGKPQENGQAKGKGNAKSKPKKAAKAEKDIPYGLLVVVFQVVGRFPPDNCSTFPGPI